MKILVLDDHILFAEGIKLVLQEADGFNADVFIAISYEKAASLMQTQHFDLVLVDLFMPGIDGFSALKRILAEFPACNCMAISSCDNPIQIQQILDVGALGFIAKSLSAMEMIKAIKQASSGEIYIPEAMRAYVNIKHDTCRTLVISNRNHDDDVSRRLQHLTPRQREVVNWVAQGKPNKQIAAILQCSEATIKAHITAILKCLKVNNRTEIARLVADNGWELRNSVA